MRSRGVIGLTLSLAVLALAGCGDDEATTSSESTVTETVSTETAETAEETPTPPPEMAEGQDGAPPAADDTVSSPTGFTSPTGNIGCFISPDSVRCDIAERDWEPPPAPADCPVDYGQGITLSAGAAPEFVCAGDTTLNSGDPLDYGRSIGAGLLRCESTESDITCIDTETGRGFSISREAYELF